MRGIHALLMCVIVAASAVPAMGQFNYIRLGDIDGMGFVTGTSPCVGEPCWPFNSPFQQPPWCPLDGSCSGGALLNAVGLPINVDGIGVLTQGDFLPDLDCSDPACTSTGSSGTHYNSDEFDNREAVEIAGLSFGSYTEVSGAVDVGSEGSGWTDVAVSGTGLGWDDCLSPPTPSYVCGLGQPTYIFDFTVTGADPNQPVYINAVFGDYDVDSSSDTVIIRTAGGLTQQLAIATQNNNSGQDGMIQMATATVPFSSVFTNWPSSTQGYLEVEFQMPNEPFVAYDYVEIGVTPLVEPTGCCCFPDPKGFGWHYAELTQNECLDKLGYYQGDGVDCPPEPPVQGACCLWAAGGFWVCVDTVDCECDFQGGTFYPNASCDEITCEPVNEDGCCCFEDPAGTGLWFKSEMSQSDCDQLNGIFAGAGTSCEGGDVSPVGACCIPEGAGFFCVELAECECEQYGGTFYVGLPCSSPQVECDPNSEIGACCYYDKETACPDCIETTAVDCLESGAYLYPVWQGQGTSCADPQVDCCQPSGACCIGHICVWTIEQTCLDADGQWTGLVSCDNLTCDGCEGDLDGDGSVDIDDLLTLIGLWGPCQ